MTFQARYRVVDHADRCTQAINQANAERSVASSIRAHTLTGGADSSSSVVSPTRPQQRKPRFVSRSNPYATIRPGTGQAIRLADITKREQLRRKKSTRSAPARLEGELCPRKKSKVANPMGSWIQRMGSIWRHDAIKTVAGTDQLGGNGKIEGDLGAGVGTGSNVIVSALEPHLRRQCEPKVLDPIGKEPTATTALLSGKERKASGRGCYGTGGMTTLQAVIDNKNLVKVSQPMIVKQQQATRDSYRRGSVVRGGTHKQWRTKQPQQQQRQVPQDNLQNLTTEIPLVTEPKQRRLINSGNVHFGSDMKIRRQAQRQDYYGQNCSSKCNGNHSRNSDSHQNCGRGCRGHKVEKSQPTGILQYSTISAVDASAGSNGNIAPPVEVSFVVSLAGPINKKSNNAPSAKTVSMKPDPCPIDGKQLKKEDDMEPQVQQAQQAQQAQQDEVVIVIEESDNMLIGNRTQELPIQIQLPPPPTIPLPSLPQIESAVSPRLETLTSDTEQLEVSGLDTSSSAVDSEGVLMQYFYHVNSQETVVLTRQDPLYLEI
ncbi:hypothetical protein BGX21_007965 [Mortierella sp. AD011]|nr:hypothetical protein BGX21_007965 [Mortierella sp. AD011]